MDEGNQRRPEAAQCIFLSQGFLLFLWCLRLFIVNILERGVGQQKQGNRNHFTGGPAEKPSPVAAPSLGRGRTRCRPGTVPGCKSPSRDQTQQ